MRTAILKPQMAYLNLTRRGGIKIILCNRSKYDLDEVANLLDLISAECKEYKKLKKKNPSYTDHYQILSLEEYGYDESILVNVKRIFDNKKFSLPLADLKSVEKDSINCNRW